jgi:hypothetical protein
LHFSGILFNRVTAFGCSCYGLPPGVQVGLDLSRPGDICHHGIMPRVIGLSISAIAISYLHHGCFTVNLSSVAVVSVEMLAK